MGTGGGLQMGSSHCYHAGCPDDHYCSTEGFCYPNKIEGTGVSKKDTEYALGTGSGGKTGTTTPRGGA